MTDNAQPTADEVNGKFAALWEGLDPSANFVEKKPLLAHYTTIQTLDRALSANELWFSNPLFMNDHHELRWGIIEGDQAFRSNDVLREACGTPERHARLIAEFGHQVTTFANEHSFDVYVFCLSEHEDGRDDDGLLSMWRGYGGNGNGAALIFDTAKLTENNDSKLLVAKVEYGSEEQRRTWIKDKVEEFAKTLVGADVPDDLLYVAAHAFFNRLKVFSLCTKHHGFQEEREWRVFYVREFDPDDRLKHMLGYLIGPRGIEPKLKLKISHIPEITAEDFGFEKIVHKIILGPSLATPMAVASAKRMLATIGHAPLVDRVFASSTPYRPT